MGFFEVHNSWNEYVVRNHETKAVRILMATLIHLNNKNRNRGFETTDRDLRDMSDLSFGSIIKARRRLMELGFVECDADSETPRRGSRYKLVAKNGAKNGAKSGAKSGAKVGDGGRHDAENRPPKKYKKVKKEKETYKEKEAELASGQATTEPTRARTLDEPDWEKYVPQVQPKKAGLVKEENPVEEPDWESYLVPKREEPFEILPPEEDDLEEPDFSASLAEYAAEVEQEAKQATEPEAIKPEEDSAHKGGILDGGIDECVRGGDEHAIDDAGGESSARSADKGTPSAGGARRAVDGGGAGTRPSENGRTRAGAETDVAGETAGTTGGRSPSTGGALSGSGAAVCQEVRAGHRDGQAANSRVNRRREKIRAMRQLSGHLPAHRRPRIRDSENQRGGESDVVVALPGGDKASN